MELRVLRYFVEAAREKSMTNAALKLHVTQPTFIQTNQRIRRGSWGNGYSSAETTTFILRQKVKYFINVR